MGLAYAACAGVVACAALSDAADAAVEQRRKVNDACAQSLPVLRGVAASSPTCPECERLPQAVAVIESVCRELARE